MVATPQREVRYCTVAIAYGLCFKFIFKNTKKLFGILKIL